MGWDLCFSSCFFQAAGWAGEIHVLNRVLCVVDGQEHLSWVWAGWNACTESLGMRKQDVFTCEWVSYFWSAPVHMVSFYEKSTLKVTQNIFVMRSALNLFLKLCSTINLISKIFFIPFAFAKEQIQMFCRLCYVLKNYHLYGTALVCVIFYIQNIEGFRRRKAAYLSLR